MTEEEIQLLIEMDLAVWNQYIALLSTQLQQGVAIGALAGLTREQIIANITDAALSAPQVETLIRSSLNNYSRSVTKAIMDDEPDDTLYQYIGPIDGRKRDICLEMGSSPFLTQSQIINEFGPDVLVYGGGYNCRHKWQSVSRIGVSKRSYNPQKAKELISDN